MEFSIGKDIFLKALTGVQGIIERRSTMPILANVLLETDGGELRITATDLEVGICSGHQAKVKKKGKTTVSARSLYEIVRELPSVDVVIRKKENDWLEIACGKAQFKLVGLGAEEFPALPTFKEDQFIGVKGEELDAMIEKAAVSVSLDETRYNLNGVFFSKGEGDQVNMVSTDGHRLSIIHMALGKTSKMKIEKGVIIPRKGLQEMRRLIADGGDEVDISFQSGNAVMRSEGRILVMRLIDGEFPDYRQVLPNEGENKNKLVVNRDILIGVLKRMAIISQQKTRGVKFAMSKGGVRISSSNPDLGEATEDIEASFSGKDLEIGFNARYLIEGLQVIPTEEVEISLNTELSPGVVKGKGQEGFKYVIMPMRL